MAREARGLQALPPAARSIARTYLLIASIFTLSASLIWGVNTLFLLHAGLDIFQVFIANAVFTASMTLFEIPTGVVADTRGRRISFLLSVATLSVGTLAYVGVAAIHGGILLFCLASVILGLGYTFYSGAVEAWMVDALRATGYEKGLDAIFARTSVVSGAAMLIGTVAGGLLGTVNLAWPFLVRASLLVGAFAVGFRAMHDVGFTPRALRWSGISGEMKKVAVASIRYGWRRPSVRLLMGMSFVNAAVFSWAFYAWQPYFLQLLGRNAVWVAGVIASLIAASTILGSAVCGRLVGRVSRRSSIMLATGAAFSVALVGVGLVRSFLPAVLLLLTSTFTLGLARPVKQAYLHDVIPTQERATVVSFDSMIGSLGSIGGQTGLGYLSQVRSVPDGFVVGGLFTLLALPLVGRLRRLGEPADRLDAGMEHIHEADDTAIAALEVVDPLLPGAGVSETTPD